MWPITSHHSHPDKGFSQFSNKMTFVLFLCFPRSQSSSSAGQGPVVSAVCRSLQHHRDESAGGPADPQHDHTLTWRGPEGTETTRVLWPCCFRIFFTCAETCFPFWDNKSMECPSTLSAYMFTVFESRICLVAKYSDLKDLYVFVSFRTTITFSKSMTSRWAVHFTFNQKWVTATAKIFSF